MGTPRYDMEFSRLRRELDNSIKGAFTVATRANSRPYVPPVISDVTSTRWPSTTTNGYVGLQYASHVNSHGTFHVSVAVSAPANGSQIRVIDEASSTVLYESGVISSGSSVVTFNISLPVTIGYYDEFTVVLQGKSVTVGQTTYAVFRKFYGGD